MGKNSNQKENQMNTITRTYTTATDAAIVVAKVNALAGRAAKKGIATDLAANVETIEEFNEITGAPETAFRVAVTFTDLVRFSGGWVLVAVADATGTDEPLIFTFDDDTTISETVDMLRCDHCERRTERNKVLFVRNDAGEQVQVGGSCAKDFLGHDPFWTTVLADALDEPTEIERGTGKFEFPTTIVLEAAIEANRLGYVKTSSEFGTPTRKIVEAMLKGSFWNSNDFADVRNELAQAPAATVTVAQVLDFMRDHDGEFGLNLRRIADSEYIGVKALGIACYAPAGATNHRAKMQERAARLAAQEAARADATPCPTGKVEIEGECLTIRETHSEYGSCWKMRVLTDAGWSAWGTIPRAIDDVEIGDRVRFTATITPSNDDNLFGFYKRPTRAKIIERAQAPSS